VADALGLLSLSSSSWYVAAVAIMVAKTAVATTTTAAAKRTKGLRVNSRSPLSIYLTAASELVTVHLPIDLDKKFFCRHIGFLCSAE